MFEPSKSAISKVFTSFVEFKRPVPKYKLERCAAYILLSAIPGHTKILTPFTVRLPLFHHCVPILATPFAPKPAAPNPPNAVTYNLAALVPMYKNKSSLPYKAPGIASTTFESSSMIFVDNNPPATAATCCAAGISPAAADAAISFSNPSKELLVAAAVSPCQIQNSVFCATSDATCAIRKSENFGGNV